MKGVAASQVERRATAAGEAPLAATAARLSALSDYFDCEAGIPNAENWHKLDELTDTELLGRWHAEVAGAVGDHRVAAAYMSNWLLSMLVGVWLLPVQAESRLPLSAWRDIAIRHTDGGWFDGVAVDDLTVGVLPDDPDAGHPTARVLQTRGQMLDSVADRLLELEPVIDALRIACPIGLPALWGTVADAVAAHGLYLARLMEVERQPAWNDAEAIIGRIDARQLRLRTRPRRFPVVYDGDEDVSCVRGTCCLYYRTQDEPDRNGDGYCTTCPIRTDESRRLRLEAWSNE